MVIQRCYRKYDAKKSSITIRSYIRDDLTEKPEYQVKYSMRDLFKEILKKLEEFVPGASQSAVLMFQGKEIPKYRRVEEYTRVFKDFIVELRMRKFFKGGGALFTHGVIIISYFCDVSFCYVDVYKALVRSEGDQEHHQG